MQRDDAYRIVQRLGQQAWDTQTPLRTLLEHEIVELDLDEVFDYGYYMRHVPDGAGAAGGDPIRRPDLRRARALARPCSTRSRRASATRSCTWRTTAAARRPSPCSTRDKVTAHGIEIFDPATLGIDELIAAGYDRLAIEAEISLRAAQPLGIAAGRRPARLPALPRRPPARRRDRADRRRRRVRPPPAAQDAAQLDGIRRAQRAADAAMGVAGDADPRAARRADVRGGPRGDAGGREEHGCELSDDAIVSHGAQSAIGHDSGSGPIARRRARRRRHLAARQGFALLRRHDAHVRGRRRRAARRAGRVLAADARLARPRLRRPARRCRRQRAVRALVRALHRGRAARPS